MSVPAVHCEALKVAYRQTKDGLVVSFVIHPNDMPDALAVAPLGTRYMLVVSQIGDDEQPVPPAGAQDRKDARLSGDPLAGEHPIEPDFSAGNLPPRAPVAAPPAGEPHGLEEIRQHYAAKERYAAMSLSEQARVRSALLPRDEQFRAWVAHERRWDAIVEVATEQDAIEHIREKCCNGGSRSLIADDPECYDKFLALETEYLVAVGRMAEPR